MEMPRNYENTPAAGEYVELPPDGYVCSILKAEERTNKNGAPMLVLFLDIAEGEYRGFFQKKWKDKKLSKPTEKVKYPNDGTAYINVLDRDGNTNRKFKAVTTAVEDSGGKIVWGSEFCNSIKGAKIGVLFGREESEWEGKSYWNTKPRAFRSVSAIYNGDYSVPADKFLEKESYTNTGFNTYASDADSFNAAEDDIPF